MMAIKQIKPRSKDREASEERLLLAAEQVFSKFGFKGATTRMIAKKADINLALITRYFDGKYGLLLKICERKSMRMHKDLLPYDAKDTVTEECTAFALLRLEQLTEDVHFFRIVIAQFLTDPKFLKRFQEALLNFETFTNFESRLQALKDQKKLTDEVSIRNIFEAIDTQIFGLVITKIIIKGRPSDETKQALTDFMRIYCQGLET